MGINLNEAELECVKLLASMFESGKDNWSYDRERQWKEIGLTKENYSPVLSMLEEYGIISNVTHLSLTTFAIFRITPVAVQVTRQIEQKAEEAKKAESEGKDIVESIKLTLKKHPVTAWAFLAFIAVTGMATAVTQIAGALKAFGLIEGKP